MLRTSKGIQLVNSAKASALGSQLTLDTKGNVLSAVDSDNSIPTYRV
jgi:hypothetical protein